MIDMNHPDLSISRQCDLLCLARSSLYYRPAGESAYNELLMRLIDEQYTCAPFYGIRRMTAWLWREGHRVNHKRVGRLMRLMGIAAIYPKPRLSAGNKEHKKYPYLLKDLDIIRPDQVWCTDITYIRLRQGFVYLAAVMDWYSRYVISWDLSITLETGSCLAALERALETGRPEIFNSDQGAQFTSQDFTGRLLDEDIRISMDGRGRVFDNIFIERLWRSVKYEEVYLHDYQTVAEARGGLGRYFEFYNNERLHQALSYSTPLEIYKSMGEGEVLNETGLAEGSGLRPPLSAKIHLKEAHFLS
jgi:putative transposase